MAAKQVHSGSCCLSCI